MEACHRASPLDKKIPVKASNATVAKLTLQRLLFPHDRKAAADKDMAKYRGRVKNMLQLSGTVYALREAFTSGILIPLAGGKWIKLYANPPPPSTLSP